MHIEWFLEASGYTYNCFKIKLASIVLWGLLFNDRLPFHGILLIILIHPIIVK